MTIRTSIAAAGAAVVLAGAGAILLPAVASAHSTTHTLKFISVQQKSVGFGKASGANQDTDVNAAGKTVGFDDVYVTFTGAKTATGNVAVDTNGGFLYGAITTTNGGKTFTGTVTGGTGAFKGATGTIAAKSISNTKAAVTITYSS